MKPPRTISHCARAAATACALVVGALVCGAGCTSSFALQALGFTDDYQVAKPDNAGGDSSAATPKPPRPTFAIPAVHSAPPANAQAPGYIPPPQYASQPIVQPATMPMPPPMPALAPNVAPNAPDNAVDPHQLTALLDEVQSLGALDPEAQRALLNNLKQCDPKLWPQIMQQFRAALSYRKQMAATSPAATKPDSSLPTATLTSAVAQLAASATASDEPPSKPAVSAIAKPAKPEAAKAEGSRICENSAADSSRICENSAAPAKAPDTKADKPTVKAAPPAPATVAPTKVTPDAAQSQLTASILELESQTASGGTTPADIERQINLRLLYLAAGRRDDAMRPISGMTPEQQQFWTKELYGLATYRDAAKEPDLQRRATEATLHLREAADRLGDLAAPVIRNLAFCKEVTSFGVYTKFPNYEFAAGDEALLYCELENLKAGSTDRGYHTAVKGTYSVLDAHGTRVAEQEFPVSDDFCANPRRDFFILYHIWMPKQIAAGSYTLQLTIEDTQSNKIGQSTVQFKVR